MNVARVLSVECLGCGRLGDVMGLMMDPPVMRPGVMFVCVDCGRLQVVADDLTWREAEAGEIVAFARFLAEAEAARGGEPLAPGMFADSDRAKGMA